MTIIERIKETLLKKKNKRFFFLLTLNELISTFCETPFQNLFNFYSSLNKEIIHKSTNTDDNTIMTTSLETHLQRFFCNTFAFSSYK